MYYCPEFNGFIVCHDDMSFQVTHSLFLCTIPHDFLQMCRKTFKRSDKTSPRTSLKTIGIWNLKKNNHRQNWNWKKPSPQWPRPHRDNSHTCDSTDNKCTRTCRQFHRPLYGVCQGGKSRCSAPPSRWCGRSKDPGWWVRWLSWRKRVESRRRSRSSQL